MPRLPRVHYPNAFYHVMVRGNNKNPIFYSPADYHKFQSLLQEGVKRFEYLIHAYCFMINHVHLLIEVKHIPLSKVMHNISFRYILLDFRQYQWVGHIFQGRFKAILVDDDIYLQSLCRYIHLNPVRANLVENPEEYHWTSHHSYLGKEKITWLTTNFILASFSPNLSNAVSQYKIFMKSECNCPNKFKFDIRSHTSSSPNTPLAQANESFSQSTSSLSRDVLIKAICKTAKVSKRQLQGQSREKKTNLARSMLCYLTQKYSISTLIDLSKFLSRDASTISRLIYNFETKEIHQGSIKELLEKIEKSIK